MPANYCKEYLIAKAMDNGITLCCTQPDKGHCLLEMPSGTGKTITILSLAVAYQKV